MKKTVTDYNFYKSFIQTMFQREYLAVLGSLGCLALSVIYFIFDLKIYASEPALKCFIICLAVGLIIFCKIALGTHIALLAVAIFWKNIPKGFGLPSLQEMRFVSILILLQVMLFYLLTVCYEEDFYTPSVYVAIQYLSVVAFTIVHTRLPQLGNRKKR